VRARDYARAAVRGREVVEGDYDGGAEGWARARDCAELVVVVEVLRCFARVDLDGVEGRDEVPRVEEVIV